MTVTVTDYIGGPVTSSFTGDEAAVEGWLRARFPGASTGVESGSLKLLLHEIGRLPFVTLKVEGQPGTRSTAGER